MMLRHASPLLLLSILAAPARAEDRRYMLTSFDSIRVDGPFEVTVTPGPSGGGPSAGAVASGERRALDSVTVSVRGTTLVVSPSVNAWGGYPGAAKSPPRVVVTVAALRSAVVNGGGKLTIARMRGARVDLTLTGSGALAVGDVQADRIYATLIGTGQMTVAGSALRGRFQSNGAGAIDAAGLQVKALTVTWQSVGDGRFAALNTAEILAAGQGAISVAGAPACIVRGSGPVVCGTK